MFSAVRIGTGEWDIGSIAEAMVYYGRVNVFVRSGPIVELVRRLGFDPVMEALDLGVLELAFERQGYAVVSNKVGNFERHGLTNVALVGTADGQKIHSAADEIEHQFRRHLGDDAETIKKARRLAERVGEIPINTQIIAQAERDLKDRVFVDSAIKAWLRAMTPEYSIPPDLHVEIVSSKDGLAFLGRVDFSSVNEVYHRHIPISHSSVTPAYLLAQFLDARKELTFAAEMNTELWVSNNLAPILQQRVNTILQAATKSQESIAYFHNVEFEGRRFREAINSGERTGAELIALLKDEETVKFKKWLAGQTPDGHLIQEYDRAVFGRHGWIERLPFKLGKIATFAGIGALFDLSLGTMGLASLAATGVSAASDVALGTTDEFVLSKLLAGWRPNQFIEGPASEFLKKSSGKD